MRQFYYFSKDKLKFVEIKNFYSKFVFLIVFFSLITSLFLFGIYYLSKEIINPDAEIDALKIENNSLEKKFAELFEKYKQIDEQLSKLADVDNSLRLAVDLEPITEEDRITGIGGSVFENIIPESNSDIENLISRLDDYVTHVSAKLNFEINNYTEIENKLQYNEELFKSIPAIKPTFGHYGDSFGLRQHPILKVKRMHNGIDIVADIGTEIYATGDAKVTFAGRKSGAGITIELDHGFGYQTSYFHLSKLLVKKGQKVKRGDLIGLTGRSGSLSSGPHLHYEVRHEGVPLNPRNFIYDDIDLFEIVSND